MAWLGEGRVAYRVLVGTPDGKRCFGRLGTEGRIILKLTVKPFLEVVAWHALTQDKHKW